MDGEKHKSMMGGGFVGMGCGGDRGGGVCCLFEEPEIKLIFILIMEQYSETKQYIQAFVRKTLTK